MDVGADLGSIEERGYVVIERLLGADELGRLRDAVQPYLAADLLGRNNFEGYRTQRVYALVDKGAACTDLVVHPRILAICDALLEANYLLTASQAINIHPGETSQSLHFDDGFYRIPRPRPAVSVSTIWAIDDFATENGATQIIAGSHRFGDGEVGSVFSDIDFDTRAAPARVPADAPPPAHLSTQLQTVTMPAGSVIVFLGTLLHRGGANRTERSRLAISNQYCQPWARQQENYTLAISAERARRLPERVQALLGYSIHPPFMGHVEGVHPRRRLERS